MTPPLFAATIALYGVACVLFFVHIYAAPGSAPAPGKEPTTLRLARAALTLAFVSHACDIGWLCTKGLHPVVDAKEALSFFAWILCGAYLFVSSRFRATAIGVLLAPLTLVLDLLARLSPSNEEHTGVGLLGIVHITLASVGVALFLVAAGAAVLYLVEERNLKAHRAGRLFGRGPALETLDTLTRRTTTAGFSFFTLALVVGAAWMLRMPGGHGLLSPQYLLSTVAWLLYAGLIAARVGVGLRGRRAAVLTLAGAATALAVLVVYLVRDSRGA